MTDNLTHDQLYEEWQDLCRTQDWSGERSLEIIRDTYPALLRQVIRLAAAERVSYKRGQREMLSRVVQELARRGFCMQPGAVLLEIAELPTYDGPAERVGE